MQSRVYRNLDLPFRILGLTAFEIIILCVILVVGGEIARTFSMNRAIPFLVVLFIAGLLSLFHRLFGERMGNRLIRFLRLPRRLSPRLMRRDPHKGPAHDS